MTNALLVWLPDMQGQCIAGGGEEQEQQSARVVRYCHVKALDLQYTLPLSGI